MVWKRYSIPICLFFFVTLVGVLVAPAIGVSWDEADNIYAGGVYWNFITHGFDQSILTDHTPSASYFGNRIFSQEPSLYRYPPFPNIVGTILTVVSDALTRNQSGVAAIQMFHITSGVFFGILVVSLFLWGRMLGFNTINALGLALLSFVHPILFGHGYANIKDIAQVSLFSTSLYLLVRGTLTSSIKIFILGSIVWGMGLATKFNAVYIPVIWTIWYVIFNFQFPLRKDSGQSIFNQTKQNEIKTKKIIKQIIISLNILLSRLFILLIIGGAVGFVMWPYLWSDPSVRVQEVIRYFTTVGTGYRVFWDNILYIVGYDRSLWWYPWSNMLLSTPILILFFFLVGLLVVISTRIMHLFGVIRLNGKYDSARLVLLLWFFVPLTRSLLPKTAFYDGIRHFMEIVPVMILLTGIGITTVGHALGTIGGNKRFSSQAAQITILICIVIIVGFNTIGQFPYSSGYYNRFAVDANTRFDRDIEGLTVKEGIDWLHKKYGRVQLWAPVSGHQTWYYLWEGDNYVYSDADADSIVLINKASHITRSNFESMIGTPYTMVHEIRRGDNVYGWVYRRK